MLLVPRENCEKLFSAVIAQAIEDLTTRSITDPNSYSAYQFLFGKNSALPFFCGHLQLSTQAVRERLLRKPELASKIKAFKNLPLGTTPTLPTIPPTPKPAQPPKPKKHIKAKTTAAPSPQPPPQSKPKHTPPKPKTSLGNYRLQMKNIKK